MGALVMRALGQALGEDDALDELAAASAAVSSAASGANAVGGLSAAADGFTNRSVGNGVAVAHQHAFPAA